MLMGMAVNNGSFGSGVASIIDIVRVAEAVREQVDPTIPAIELQVAGPSATVALSSDMVLHTTCALGDLERCDVVIVPALGTLTGEATRTSLESAGANAIISALERVDPDTTRLAAIPFS